MEFFLARQAIFDKTGEIIGYELFHRSSAVNKYQQMNGDIATLDLLAKIIQTDGFERVTDGKLAFVNYTRNLLLQNIPLIMPSKTAVVEIHEDVQAERQIIEACRNLSQKGYMIVLDDFIYRRDLEPLVLLADIIKIDFRKESRHKIELGVRILNKYRSKLLAEKVETEQEFIAALGAGFDYFQGNFFSQTEIISGDQLVLEFNPFFTGIPSPAVSSSQSCTLTKTARIQIESSSTTGQRIKKDNGVAYAAC